MGGFLIAIIKVILFMFILPFLLLAGAVAILTGGFLCGCFIFGVAKGLKGCAQQSDPSSLPSDVSPA